MFTKNRDRVLNEEIVQAFQSALLADPKVERLLYHDHVTVDGTQLKAWPSLKSFLRRDGGDAPLNGGRIDERDFPGERRPNETHASTTNLDTRPYRKGQGPETWLVYMGHVLMENWRGLAVLGEVTQPSGEAEREAALSLIDS